MRIQGMDAAMNMNVSNDIQLPGSRAAESVQMKIAQDRISHQRKSDAADYPINERIVSEAVEKMNKVVDGFNRRFEYSIHEGTNEIMIKVIDETTNEVIKEIPPKKILDMIASMLEMAGLLVDERR
jgi:flagellar protein FlaG